jgi:hypothetical protein
LQGGDLTMIENQNRKEQKQNQQNQNQREQKQDQQNQNRR